MKSDKEIGQILSAIETRLALIEELFAWVISGEQRFKVKDPVVFSRRAIERGISKGRRGGVTSGKIVAINSPFIISVLLDCYKRPSDYHHSFFNPVKGPKLF